MSKSDLQRLQHAAEREVQRLKDEGWTHEDFARALKTELGEATAMNTNAQHAPGPRAAIAKAEGREP